MQYSKKYYANNTQKRLREFSQPFVILSEKGNLIFFTDFPDFPDTNKRCGSSG